MEPKTQQKDAPAPGAREHSGPETREDAGQQPGQDAAPGPAEDPGDVAGPGPAEDDSTPVLGDVLLAVEELWPRSLAEQWDAVGPVVGRSNAPVRRILFAVDPVTEVVEEAVAWGADLLVTHHPLLLKPVNSVAASSFKGNIVHQLIESGCALVTVHTNGDSAVGGVSDVLADAFGLQHVKPLSPSVNGLPEEGIGRVGELGEATTLGTFAETVFSLMPAVAGGVKVAGNRDALVRTIAVCGGAGDSLFDAVREAQADVYVTADLRHHPASEAREAAVDGRPYLIDVSHFGSEWLWLTPAAAALENVLADQGYDVEIRVSGINTDPWDFILTPA
ncbi:Nif3-like dinuclear metal center hexameric protein [Arthrobacter mobilis]|uniref:GTP cyclohydrolase 1 type 2 homolog n=1 Tax=Arthrobacter mobilis TaxID=2724944 RepID=A0A7X6K7A6_9MICC|nr:Nif3-like dinuclear metal center hexameric protein [Arthrobacter mobilis]NKX56471.1 Nif3-like dinuclear metal center hexameric protein [Arthrobacter mobilis]